MHTPSRRSFIKSSAALAGTAFAPNLVFGQEKALKQLNVASVGCNGKGASDISEISSGNRIAFLCDIDEDKAKSMREKYPEAKYFSDYREMFASVADQIDVVTVSTPDHMHFPIAVEAIRHGKPVMVQKPLCNTLWEARALANYAKESHSMNSAFWVLDLKGDFVVESSKVSAFDESMAPKRATIVYNFPAKGKRAAVKVIWQDGVNNPNTDKDFVRPPGIPADLQLNNEFGQVFVGTEGTIFINDAYSASSPVVFPESLRAKSREIKKVYDRVKGGPTQELCRAVRGDGPKPVSNFVDHAGPLTEMVLAGNLSVRLGKKIDWDSKNMEARGLPEVKAMLKRKYRAGWEPKLS